MSFNDSRARIERLGLMGMIVCLLIISLSGCGRITPTGGPAAAHEPTAMPMSGPVTITFAYNQVDADFFEALVEEFNGLHPHIAVDLRPETEEGLMNLEAGDADVRPVWQVVFDSVQERGDILSLEPFIEQDESFDLSDFYPAALATVSTDGKVWAIPFGANPLVIYYNQDLFDQYGVPYPEIGWTWDDFLSAALAVRDPEADVFGYVNLVGLYSPLTFVYQHGGRIFDDMQNPTRVTLDDPLTVEALEWYAQLYNEHDVASTWPSARARSAIVDGRVGMWTFDFFQQGGWNWPAEWPMRWGMVTLPRDAQAATGGMCGGYAISSRTQQPDAAWQWVAFLSRHPLEHMVPARKSIVESTEYEWQAGEDIAALARDSLENGLFFSPGVYTRFAGALDIFEDAVAMIVSGDWTPQEAMEWAQREAESRIGP